MSRHARRRMLLFSARGYSARSYRLLLLLVLLVIVLLAGLTLLLRLVVILPLPRMSILLLTTVRTPPSPLPSLPYSRLPSLIRLQPAMVETKIMGRLAGSRAASRRRCLLLMRLYPSTVSIWRPLSRLGPHPPSLLSRTLHLCWTLLALVGTRKSSSEPCLTRSRNSSLSLCFLVVFLTTFGTLVRINERPL